ncbi:MCE family protein [Nocardioides sp. BP30]|uniref:MCE family protein n=1 Tax=Nocardioides sp. BP30 TaxID=3036374 RepID=UPI0024684A52|nr:MCE family protein [Nocardioides sp. BP30]WGL53041.1 MCE family protein [Nocardioides sp. BP30]
MSRTRIVDAFLGLGYLLVVVAFLASVVLIYNKAFTHRSDITLTTSSMGNALQKGSDVKYHGVPVGEVSAIAPTQSGARLTLALEPSVVKTLPADTTALLLPKTLFGERYVDLVAPSSSSPGGLAAGATIAQDSSDEAVQLQDVFDHLLPLLQALEPQKLQATLGELAAMLRGEGDAIGDNLASWADYFHKINPDVPQLADDFASLGKVADTYADAVPDLLDALDTMTTTSHTLVQEQTQLSSVFANVLTASDITTGFMDDNSQTITVLSKQSRKALQAVAPYASEFPCLLKATADFVPVMDRTLGKGTKEPGMHVVLSVEPSRGKYVAGKDAYTATSGGPRCPYQTGQVGTSAVGRTATAGVEDEPPTIPAPPSDLLPSALTSPSGSASSSAGTSAGSSTSSSADVDTTSTNPAADLAAAGLGDANSPAENELIAELVAPSVGMSPSQYPRWGSLLLGPVLRGTEVTLR